MDSYYRRVRGVIRLDLDIEVIKERFDLLLDKYMTILDIMMEHQAVDGYSYISQSKIADRLNCSPNIVSQKIRVMEKYQAIRRRAPGVYEVLQHH